MQGDTTSSIWARLEFPNGKARLGNAADGFLSLGFSDLDRARLAELAEKSNEGTLTPEESQEYGKYNEVSDALGLLQSKARLWLQMHSTAA